MGYTKLTAIQEKSLPLSLDNKDLIAQAKTGSGKTVSFCIPILNKINIKNFRIQSLILAPTRELANQIAQELRKLSRHIHNLKVLTLCGGMPFKPQALSLSHGCHIVVGTPGRVLKHIEEENISLENINTILEVPVLKNMDIGLLWEGYKLLETVQEVKEEIMVDDKMTFELNDVDLDYNFDDLLIDESIQIWNLSPFQILRQMKYNKLNLLSTSSYEEFATYIIIYSILKTYEN